MKSVESRLDELEEKMNRIVSILDKKECSKEDNTINYYNHPEKDSEKYWEWVHHDRKNNLSDNDYSSKDNYFNDNYLDNDLITHCLVWFDFEQIANLCKVMNYNYGFNSKIPTVEELEKNAFNCLQKVYDYTLDDFDIFHHYQMGRIHAYSYLYERNYDTSECAYIITDKNGKKWELNLKLSFEAETSSTSPY